MNETRLTRLGWLRRQRKLASEALARYPIDFDRVDLVSTATNFIYRARDVEGRLYALRLVAPGWRTELNLEWEARLFDNMDTRVAMYGVVRPIYEASLSE